MSNKRNQHLPLAKSAGSRNERSDVTSKGLKRRDTRKHSLPLSALVLATGMAHLAPAQAHDVWLAIVEQSAPADADVRVGLLIGEHAGIEAMPFNPSRVERMWLKTTEGVDEITVTGPQVSLDSAQNHGQSRTLAYISKPAASVLPAAKFDDYLREEHLQSILLQRQRKAEPVADPDGGSMVSERYSRSLKLLLKAAEQALIDCPVGLPLELSLVAADDAHVVVQATFRGVPLAGVWVDRGAADGSPLVGGVTDSNGRISLVRSDGDWIVRATHMLADDVAGSDWRSWWATTSFHLSAAGVSTCAIP